MPYYSQADRTSIPDLHTALYDNTVDSLKTLAALLAPGTKKPIRKADLVDFIERRLSGDGLRTCWQQLDETQQAAIAETVYGPDGRFNEQQFTAKYGREPVWGEYDRYGFSLRKPSLLALFFFDGVMPEDVRQRFRAFVPEPEAAALRSHREIPGTVTQTVYEWDFDDRRQRERTVEIPVIQRPLEREACHDLKAVLRLIDTGKLNVSDKTFQPGVAAQRAVQDLLLGGDYYDDAEYETDEKIGPIKPFAWPLLVQAGGLARLNGKQLELTAGGRKALNAPPEQTLALLWKRWLKTKLFDELRRIDCIKGQTGKGKRGLTAVAGRRAAINAALHECPPGEWIGIDEFFRQMVVQGHMFEVTRDPWRLYIAEPGYGNLGENCHGWHILQLRYGLCVLFEYAATLGLIDVAYVPPHDARPDYGDLWGTDGLDFLSRYDGLLYLRLNPLGAYCLGMAESYTPSRPEARTEVRVLPNLEIVVSGGTLEPADELMLNTYACKVSDAVWQLEQARLLAAIEAGQDVATLRRFLESASAAPLPDTVLRFLKDMDRRAERLQDKGAARLIECADAALATLIANDSRTKPHCLLAADRYLVVPAESETRFRTALRKLGYSLPQ